MKCADQTHEQAVLTLARDLWNRRQRERNDTPGTCRLCAAALPVSYRVLGRDRDMDCAPGSADEQEAIRLSEDPPAWGLVVPVTICESSARLYRDAQALMAEWRARHDRDAQREHKRPVPQARGGW